MGLPLRDMEAGRPVRDDVEDDGGGVGTSVGACDPKSRRVDENKRDGSLRVEEN